MELPHCDGHAHFVYGQYTVELSSAILVLHRNAGSLASRSPVNRPCVCEQVGTVDGHKHAGSYLIAEHDADLVGGYDHVTM